MVSGVVLFLSSMVVLTEAYLVWTNTPETNGNWVSVKCEMARPLMGAKTYMEGRQALAKGRLNLGAWHGFQEVFYKEQLAASLISFDFFVQDGGYLVFFFSNLRGLRTGIRLSANPMFPNAFIVADELGRFLEKTPITGLVVEPGHWHRFKLVVNGSVAESSLDDQSVPPRDLGGNAVNVIGFRGSASDAFVDNIRADEWWGTFKVWEDFSNKSPRFPIYLECFRYLLVLSLCAYLVCRLRGTSFHNRLAALTSVHSCYLFVAIMLLGYAYLFSERYPSVKKLDRSGEDWYIRFELDVLMDMDAEFVEPSDPEANQIVFIGTSQTWGAGVRSDDDVFARVVEKELNEARPGGRGVRCLNAGINAADLQKLMVHVKEEWIRLSPRLVIVNLSTNDSASGVDPVQYEKELSELVDVWREAGSEVLFVLEANALEAKTVSRRLHPAMRQVSREKDVPLINMQEYLDLHYDDGFLWWDFVHMTSFGHRLVADHLMAEILGRGLLSKPDTVPFRRAQ